MSGEDEMTVAEAEELEMELELASFEQSLPDDVELRDTHRIAFRAGFTQARRAEPDRTAGTDGGEIKAAIQACIDSGGWRECEPLFNSGYQRGLREALGIVLNRQHFVRESVRAEQVRKARANRRAMSGILEAKLEACCGDCWTDTAEIARRVTLDLDVWPRILADPLLPEEPRVEPPLTIDLMNALKNEVLVQRLWDLLNAGELTDRVWTQEQCREILADLVKKSR